MLDINKINKGARGRILKITKEDFERWLIADDARAKKKNPKLEARRDRIRARGLLYRLKLRWTFTSSVWLQWLCTKMKNPALWAGLFRDR